MKELLMSVFFVFSLQVPLLAKEKRACYRVEGMTCATCPLTVKASVKKLDGIFSVEASLENKSASVEYDPQKTNVETIKKKIDSIGYKAIPKKCSPTKG
ncbi:MAG: heavy-metal-associated domain-containing protein [Bdellovibrio sp.]|nr:MAG: heavy-metal-associated domain-containing protein [Bdellovibrio sp.]